MSLDKRSIHGKIAVLLGGESSERDVSLQSGSAVVAAFGRLGIDVVAIDVKTAELVDVLRSHPIRHAFIALHGGAGENGQVQAILESLGISYTGSGVLGCAIAMDKQRTKLLWRGAGIPTADFIQVTPDTSWQEASTLLGNRMMMKPSCEGSSIGMTVVDSEASYYEATATAMRYGSDVIAEKWIDGQEYTVAILGDEVLPMIRLQTGNRFYDYQAKYESEETQYLCPCGLPAADEAKVKEICLRAFRLLGCSGWGRIDVMRDRDGSFYLLEANTVPGMTSHSLVPMAAKAAGYSFDDLVAAIFQGSLRT
jgi:D-alanine-D-alanine ligase